MVATIAPKKITVPEFFEMDFEDGTYYELINGIIVSRQAPAFVHQNACMNLSRILSTFVKEKQLGKILASPFDVHFDNYNVTQPDLLFVKNERNFIITDHGIDGAPDLIIEILSPSTFRFDRREKYKLYQAFGVAEYWIIEPTNKSVEVYVLENNVYDMQFSAVINGTIQSKVLEGFNLEITSIFE